MRYSKQKYSPRGENNIYISHEANCNWYHNMALAMKRMLIQLNERYHMLTDIRQDLLIRKRAMMALPELAGISHTRTGSGRIAEVD